MSVCVSTDIFCDGRKADGYICGEWVPGVVSIRAERRDALMEARYAGWVVSRKGHFCRACWTAMGLDPPRVPLRPPQGEYVSVDDL